jgi:hypothetical protein
MRPRISYLALALQAATGASNVTLVNQGTLDALISTTLPGGGVSWGVWRTNPDGSLQLLASNLPAYS